MYRKSFFGNSTDHPGRHKKTVEKAERWLMIAELKPLQRQKNGLLLRDYKLGSPGYDTF